MSAPQTKEGPASLLRAMFAGFGSLMSVMDKVRRKPAAEAPSDAEAAAPAPAAPQTPAQESTAAEATAPEATAPEAAETEAIAAEATAVEATAVEATAVEATAVEPEGAVEPVPAVEPAAGDAGALPLANYEELTIASLRARLRTLTNDDLNQLMAYEKAHKNRPEVVKMFQNRLIKMTTGMPKLES